VTEPVPTHILLKGSVAVASTAIEEVRLSTSANLDSGCELWVSPPYPRREVATTRGGHWFTRSSQNPLTVGSVSDEDSLIGSPLILPKRYRLLTVPDPGRKIQSPRSRLGCELRVSVCDPIREMAKMYGGIWSIRKVQNPITIGRVFFEDVFV